MTAHLDSAPRVSPRVTLLGMALTALALVVACKEVPPEHSGLGRDVAALQTPSLATFARDVSAPFGTFNGIVYVRHTGLFEGRTSLGAFRMPYEIIVPEDPSHGNGTVLMEPPHFAFGPAGRDFVLGRDLLFGNGFSYAAVGWGDDLLNVLDPTAQDLLLAGEPVANPGAPNPAPTLDEEILIEFSEALTSAGFALEALGAVDRVYAYGVSQTAAGLMELQRAHAAGQGASLFDFTLLHVALWRPPFEPPGVWEFLNDEFQPIEGVGRVFFVESEGDRIISEARDFRRAAGVPGYRVYELAGAAHLPAATNPLDHLVVARALFVAGDAWVRSGIEPPPNTLLEAAPAGEIDPAYGFETGISRDGDLNARGGVRLPDLAVGRARFVAWDPASSGPDIPPEFAFLTGNMLDLACEPAPESPTSEPRFRNHGDYVSAFTRHVNELRRLGFLLEADADELKEQAASSEVGKPGTCP